MRNTTRTWVWAAISIMGLGCRSTTTIESGSAAGGGDTVRPDEGGGGQGTGGDATSDTLGQSTDSGAKAPCQTWQTRCEDACVDLQTDAQNCGACGVACEPEQEVCDAGACVEKACAPGETRECSSAPTDTLTGACKAGTQTCLEDLTGFGPCFGEVLPAPEICGDLVDDDCDGVADDGCP